MKTAWNFVYEGLMAGTMGIYSLFMLHMLWPETYHRLTAWLVACWQRVHDFIDRARWEAKWDRLLDEGEA